MAQQFNETLSCQSLPFTAQSWLPRFLDWLPRFFDFNSCVTGEMGQYWRDVTSEMERPFIKKGDDGLFLVL